MAQKTIVTLIDDLTGEESEQITTAQFALDGVSYEIDLTDKNAAELHDALSAFVSAARQTAAHRRGRGRRRTSGDAAPAAASRPSSSYNRETLKAMRGWAKQNGHQVSGRGRLSAEVIKAWEGEHQGSKAKGEHQGSKANGQVPALSG